jgi:hypothetical protein
MSDLIIDWIYVLDENYVYDLSSHLPDGWNEGRSYQDRDGVKRLEIHSNGKAHVLTSYAWDGCTPKFSLFDIMIGIPDGVPNHATKKPKAYYASLVHDVLYQFLDAEFPLSRSQVDRVFLDILSRDQFAPRWIYYAAVRLFGGLAHPFSRWKRNHAGKWTPL